MNSLGHIEKMFLIFLSSDMRHCFEVFLDLIGDRPSRKIPADALKSETIESKEILELDILT